MVDSASSRATVLEAVKEQVFLAARTPANGKARLYWSAEQWHQAFSYLFVTVPPHHIHHHDDLLFFVHTQEEAKAKQCPYSVRRKAASLPADFDLSGSMFPRVSFRDTLLLNLVLQSSYELTVVACSQDALPQVAEGRWSHLPGVTCVTKQVYASPAHTSVNLDDTKARPTQPVPAYPDICFAVDNFEDAFDDVVLSQPDDCYCVLLQAVAPPSVDSQPHSSSNIPTVNTTRTSSIPQPRSASKDRITLFSGYVSHQQIQYHLASVVHIPSPTALFGALFKRLGAGRSSKSSSSVVRDNVLMAGPGGVGRAEVAVAKLNGPPSSVGKAGDSAAHPTSEASQSQVVQGAAASSSGSSGLYLPSGPLGQAAAGGGASAPSPPACYLQCALISMSLPVESLAHSLLGIVHS